MLPLNLPADGGAGVVDCFGSQQGDSDLGPVADWHQKIIDQVVEINETVMDHYLDVGEGGLSGAELHDAFEQCLREGHLVPVCFVSARSGAGVPELLDIAETLFPHPGEANPPPFVKGSGNDAQPVDARPDPDAHVIADVFKIVNDPFVGKLGIFRVYQGTVRRDMQLFVDDGRKPFKVAHLFQLRGKDHVEIEPGHPRRHRRGGEDRRAALRCGAARFARRGPHPPGADGVPEADVRAGGGAGQQGPGTEAGDRTAQAGRGGPGIRGRAQRRDQRNGDPRPVRPAPADHAATG